MSSSNIVESPVQSQNVQSKWVTIVVAVGLIAGAVGAVLSAQNLSTNSSAGEVEMTVPDSRMSIPTGSSWHVSPSIDSRLIIPTGSSWYVSPSIDSRTSIPTGSSWHQSPIAGSVAMDKRLSNPHGTSWFQSATATDSADAAGN